MSNFTWADELGRAMARSDMKKTAHENELAKTAAQAGVEVAKLANLGALAMNFAKKNPAAVIGGGLGALHGLMKQDGGVGSALTEGAVGAGLGAGAHHLMNKGLENPGVRAVADVAKDRVLQHPSVAGFVDDVYKKRGLANPYKVAAAAQELEAIASDEKVAFGAAIAGALSRAAPAVMNFVKSNPLKAGLGAASGVGNFMSARKNGEGVGSALLSGAAGAASAL